MGFDGPPSEPETSTTTPEQIMALKHKLTALAVLVLAVLFNQFFMFAKHDPSVAAIVPFADDPYDAIGSIALIVSALLAVLSLFRVFKRQRPEPPSVLSKVFLARAQAAVPAGVLVALGADLIAMVRHQSLWAEMPAARELIASMAGMAAISIAVLFLVRASVRGIGFVAAHRESRRTAVVLLVCVAVLAFFPEDIIRNVFLHFLSIVAGFVLFLASQAALSVAILPYRTAEDRIEPVVSQWYFRPSIQWSAAAILGLAIGAYALIGEVFVENAGIVPFRQVLVVAAMFIGAGTSGMLIAFAFLKEPLGLFRKLSH